MGDMSVTHVMNGRSGGRVQGVTLTLVLAGLDEAFDRVAWHGPNLLSSIRGVQAAEAAWRPGPGRPCIEEIVLHCAYWKHRVRERVTTSPGTAPARFPHAGRNWFAAPEPLTAARWRADIALLKRTHAALLEAVAELSESAFLQPGPRQTRTRLQHVRGIAFHDVYHAGQIRVLRKLYAQASA